MSDPDPDSCQAFIQINFWPAVRALPDFNIPATGPRLISIDIGGTVIRLDAIPNPRIWRQLRAALLARAVADACPPPSP